MKRALPLLLYVAGAALFTVLVVSTVDRGPFQRGLTGSELAAWQGASRVAGGEGEEGAGSSLYLRFLSLLTKDDPTAIRDARRTQTWILLPLFSLGVFLLATRRAGRWWGVLAGLLAIVAGPAALHAGGFGPAMIAGILGLAALLVLDGEPNAAAWLVGGSLVGIAAHVEPTLAWALFLLLLFFALRGFGRSRRPVGAGCFVLGAVAASILVGVLLEGPRVPGLRGMEVYRGHASLAGGTAPRRSGEGDLRWWALRDYVREASRAKERSVTAAEADAYWGWRGHERVYRAGRLWCLV